jgi:1-acyl-sn-glycerol-3-phosphate acyltransferase
MKWIKRQIGRLWLLVFGWRIETEMPVPDKMVYICAPHTSNWDLPFMLAVTWTLGIDVAFLAKKSIFRFPFGPFFRWLGALPVDRSAPHGLVAQAAQLFTERDVLRLGVPPEGTRKKVELWKSGFYHIARAAQVQIGLGYLDFEKKRGGFGGYFVPTGDIARDMDHVREFYRDVRGKFPALESAPRLREELGEPRAASA